MKVQSQFIEMFKGCKMIPLKKVACFSKASINPIEGVKYTLFSFPAFDNNCIPEIVDGGEIKSSKLKLEENVILYNKLNVRLSRVWNINELSSNNNVCSSEFLPIKVVNKDLITKSFLYRILCSEDVTKKMVACSTGTSNSQKRISPASLLSLDIPIPSMDEQMKFVAIAEQADKSKFVGFKSQFIEMFGNPLSQVQRYPLEKLGDCCELNPRRPSTSLSDTDMVSFVPMPCVSENGYLQDVAEEEYGKVKKGFTYFENNDVLFAKITPCMENGKGAIAQELTNGIGVGSTEFHVLRPVEGKSNSYWLLALTRMPIFRERASKNMSGTGGQKRVGAPFLDNFMVGLPPIEEQNRFERIYKQADKSKYYYQIA